MAKRALGTIAYEIVKLDTLVPDSANARKHGERNVSEIMQSLREFGQHAPLVVQRTTNRILVGNGRYEAMLRLGWVEAPVHFVDDDNITAVRRALADNRTAELAEWDNDMLAKLLVEVGNNLPGWTEEELAALPKLSDVDSFFEEKDTQDALTEDEGNDGERRCPMCGAILPS